MISHLIDTTPKEISGDVRSDGSLPSTTPRDIPQEPPCEKNRVSLMPWVSAIATCDWISNGSSFNIFPFQHAGFRMASIFDFLSQGRDVSF